MNITQEQEGEDSLRKKEKLSNMTVLDAILELIELEKNNPNDLVFAEKARELIKSL